MSTTPEGKVKKQVKKVLDELGIVYFMPVNTGLGKAGVSDFVGVMPCGLALFIETKATEKDMPTELQKCWLRRCDRARAIAIVVDADNLEVFRDAFSNLEVFRDAFFNLAIDHLEARLADAPSFYRYL